MTEEQQEIAEDITDDGQEAIVEEDSPETIAPEPQPVKDWSDEEEQIARELGWKAPEDWGGEKPAGYIANAREWLERWERHPVFKKQAERFEKQQADLARRLDAVNKATQDRIRKEYEDRMAAITAAQRQAASEADTDAFDRLEQQRQKMLNERPEAQTEPERTNEPPPEITDYQSRNEWAQDPLMWHEAVQAVQAGLNTGVLRTNDPKAQLEFAEAQMKRRYPHLFKASEPEPKPKPRVDSGGGLGAGPATGRSAFEKLPKEAKEQFNRDLKRGTFKDTKEDREWFANEFNSK